MVRVNEIHDGDVGTLFTATIKDGDTPIDVSTATTKEFIFQKPDGTTFTKAASFKTDGSDGILQYTSTADVLTPAGSWKMQGHVVFGVNDFKTSIYEFVVHDNLA